MGSRTIRALIFLLAVSSSWAKTPTFHTFQKKSPIVILDPAGHGKDPGRVLGGGYERGETLTCVEALHKQLQKKYKKIRFIISHSPGEVIQPLQLASFSNRLHADLYMRIQMYQETSVKPKVAVYYHLLDPLVDMARRSFVDLSLISLHAAHRQYIHITQEYARKMLRVLNKDSFKKHFDCLGAFGIPLKHHVGIQAPAITLELGIDEERKWWGLLNPIVDSLSFLADF